MRNSLTALAVLAALEPEVESTQDRLSREPFARFLAERILKNPRQGAEVFALCGGWGSGKTWTAHKIVEQVGSRANVVTFEPWMLSGSEALARQFFATLEQAIKGQAPNEARQEALKRLYAYSSALLAAGAAVALGIGDPKIGGVVASATLLARLKAVTDAAKEAWKVKTDPSSVQVLRGRVSEALRELDQPMLIVIDDIERLDEEEVRTLFRLIKACADFPNVRYLLLYDRAYVANALGGGTRDGEAFLDKIVHGTYDLPELTYDQRLTYLDEVIERLLPSRPLGDSYDRLTIAFEAVLLPGLSTLRLIERYSMMAGNIASVMTYEGALEVDPADFLLLEYLRQREPAVYTVLRELDTPRAGGRIRRMAFKDEVEKAKRKRLDDAMPKDEERRQIVEEALDALAGSSAISGSGDLFSATERDHLSRRFKSEEWRPVYFGFELARATLSSAEFDELRRGLADDTLISLWMRRFDDHDRRSRVARVLSLRFPELSVTDLTNFLVALVRWGEDRPYDQPAGLMGWSSWTDFLGELGLAVLEQISSRGDAAEAWTSMLARTGAILGPASILGRSKLESSEDERKGRWASAEDIALFEASVLAKVREVMLSDEVWQRPNPAGFYTALYELSDEEARAWYGAIKDEMSRVVGWINKILPNYLQTNGQTNLSPPEDEAFLEAIRSAPEERLTSEGSRARKSYLDSIQSRRRRRV